MSSKYQARIDKAEASIRAKGVPIVIRRRAGSASLNTFDEGDFGAVTSSGSTFTFSSGAPADSISTGAELSFREIGAFGNRGPFIVTGVAGLEVTVDGTLTDATEDSYYLDVESTPYEDASGVGIPLPPQSVTKQSFMQAFRDGTLQISRAQDVLLAAKGLLFDPAPGNRIQFGTEVWQADGDVWLIHGIGALQPDTHPIIWEGIVTRG